MFSLRSTCCMIILLILSCGNEMCAEKDYFTSFIGMEEILNTETFLLSHLQSYVTSMTSQLNMIKNEIANIEEEHSIAANGLEEYLTNPVNAYLLIKRLDKNWRTYEDKIRDNDGRQSFLDAIEFARANLSFPTEEDAEGSAIALVRLQETYQLDVSQIAAGILNGVKYGSPMSWQDCFQLGQQLYTLNDFNHTILWMKESFEKLRVHENYNSTNTVEVLETMAQYHSQMGDFKTALNVIETLLGLEPGREKAIEFKKFLAAKIEEGHVPYPPPLSKDVNMLMYRTTKEFKAFEKICRGEIKPQPWEERDLRCKFFHRNVPYRLLMPHKMEEINIEPYVVVFHDVMSDKEIEPIKEIAKPQMARSQPFQRDEVSSTNSLYRTSQNSWIHYDSLPETKKISQRLEDITGFDMEDNELLQVANYGLGGHYDPHFDFYEGHGSFDESLGNRIATAIFYLSDVDQGGATAFVFLNRAVKPEKGSVLLWYNLHKSGEKDYRTKHGACPVLKGSKWIGNVWIRSRKQLFKRPCGLQPDHEVSLSYKYPQFNGF